MPNTPGRNDPCPCGSGRKYKHCCLASLAATQQLWQRLREAEGRLIPELLEFGLTRTGKPGFAAAWKYFSGGTVPLEEAAEDPDFERLFLIWFLFDWQRPLAKIRCSTRQWPAKPIAEAFLDARSVTDGSLEDRYVRAALAAPLSFAVIESVVPGWSVDLRDILTGARHTVLERTASQSAEPGGILCTRVLTVETASLMLGCGHWVIPPAFHNLIIDFRQRCANGALALDARAVKMRHAEVVDLYGHIVEELLHPTPPKLQNTDGDPLAPTKMEFELQCSQERAVERLAGLAYGHTLQDLIEDAERDAAGKVEYLVPWLVPGNRVHKEWENTSLGAIKVTSTGLEAEVNSERRATRLRKEIERRLRGEVLFLRQETTSVEALLREQPPEGQTGGRPDDIALKKHPEVRARLRQMEERHWEAWLDEPVPALGGLTPRAAAATALGRERLEALLADYAYRERKREPDERVDIEDLRERLGLR